MPAGATLRAILTISALTSMASGATAQGFHETVLQEPKQTLEDYGPLKAFNDQSWVPNDIVLIE